MNIAAVLCRQAANPALADRPALIESRRGTDVVVSFAELERRSAQAAALLEQNGLKPGDAVLVFYPMSIELYVALLAIFRLGLVAMFLDPSAGRDHIERCCALLPPRGFIASPKAHLLRLWSGALRRIPIQFVIGLPVPCARRWSRWQRLAPRPEVAPCAADAPALVTFTSGSTGQPKATVRTHEFLLIQHGSLAEALQLEAGDVDLATLPIVLLANLASGVTSIIPEADLRFPGSIDPDPVLLQIERHRPVSSTASPAFFECLTRRCVETRRTLPSFRKLFTGGAPVFPRALDQLQALAPHADVVAVYGSTEAEPIAHVARRELQPADYRAMLAGKGLLAGLPVPAIQVRIHRDCCGIALGPCTQAEFAANCLAAGQPGEIVVSGPHVLKSYLHGRGDEETKFRVDGVVWHRTGDAGYLDEQGRLWLLGRCSARIEDGRGTLYPFAAETAVYQDPHVRRAALVAHRGRHILAVEYHIGKAPADLEPLRQALAWAHLDEIRILPRVPVDKRHNAKIDYPGLHAALDRVS